MIRFEKYLADGRDFLSICNAILAECIDTGYFEETGILQITPDNSSVCVIAMQSFGNNTPVYTPGGYVSLSDMPYLGTEPYSTGGMMYVPVLIRESVAMYMYGIAKGDEPDDTARGLMTSVSMIIQNIAARKNYEDSLQNSYRLVWQILDIVPTGIIVLDRINRSVLMMNRVAAQSEAVQRVVGKSLCSYTGSDNSVFEGIYDDETGLWFDVRFMAIKWLNEEDVVLCTALDVTQKVKTQLKAEYQANNDYLTGLFNRMKCERDLAELIQNTDKKERGIVIYLDLDDFKQVNDGLGHQYGDVLLQEISTFISGIEPIANSCYRMGGDEFVIVIGPDNFSRATEIVQKITERFALPWDLLGNIYYSTMSMGLAVFPDDGTHMHDVLKKADFAMYEAKKGGKNRYMWYAECSDDKTALKQEADAEFKKAVEAGCEGFGEEYYFIKDTKGKPQGLCIDISYDNMNYDGIISLAEYGGLVCKVMRYVGEKLLSEAFRQGQRAFLFTEPVQILAKDVVDEYVALANECNIDPADIFLCVSDGAEFRDKNRAAANLGLLKAHGFKIAVRDFGEGDMSLKRIFSYRADAVIVKDPKLLSGMLEIAKDFGFDVLVQQKDN